MTEQGKSIDDLQKRQDTFNIYEKVKELTGSGNTNRDGVLEHKN